MALSPLISSAFDRCLAHWGGEFAIAVAYFGAGSPWRTPQRDRSWLEFQVWKEWYGSGVYGPRGVTVQDVLREALSKIALPDAGASLAELEAARDALDFGKDEFAHFTALFELWQGAWPDAAPRVAEWGALPEGQALSELRYQLREDPLGEIAVRLSEGGGLGLFFGIQEAVSGDEGPFERGLVRAVDRILSDERYHLIGNFVWAARRLQDPAEVARVVTLLDRICAVKLREREAQFQVPVADLGGPEALAAAGEIYRARYLAPMRAEIARRLGAGAA